MTKSVYETHFSLEDGLSEFQGGVNLIKMKDEFFNLCLTVGPDHIIDEMISCEG